jgi:Terminase large subunit, T4likevirus-type, N-terminal
MTTASVLARVERLEAAVSALAGDTPLPSAVELMEAGGMVPDPWQQRVCESQAPRLLLNCSRQSGKSQVVAAVALAAALQTRAALILVISPSERQSGETLRKVLHLYQAWGMTIPPTAESTLKLELSNGSRLLALPGREHTIRGFSTPTAIIVDEAARTPDDLYIGIRPMRALGQTRLVALSTPWGKRGWWYHAWISSDGWERYEVPASACPRISSSFIAEERAGMSRAAFASEYCCEFCDVVDQVFLSEDGQAALTSEGAPFFAGGGDGLYSLS